MVWPARNDRGKKGQVPILPQRVSIVPGPHMKMIIAVIQPTRLRAVQEALTKVGVQRVTICDGQEFAKREDKLPVYRGRPPETNILRKISLQIAVNDDFLQTTVDTIINVARTGHRGNDGDGKVFVLPLEEAVQLSPPQRGKSAI
jgi:nitrogen regulatory protein P-II 1